MDCYSVTNPTDGQTCNDDVLGTVVYNATDGTWEKKEGYIKSGNSIFFDLSTLPGNQPKGLSASVNGLFSGQYGVLLIGALVFIGVLFLWALFGKKQ